MIFMKSSEILNKNEFQVSDSRKFLFVKTANASSVICSQSSKLLRGRSVCVLTGGSIAPTVASVYGPSDLISFNYAHEGNIVVYVKPSGPNLLVGTRSSIPYPA